MVSMASQPWCTHALAPAAGNLRSLPGFLLTKFFFLLEKQTPGVSYAVEKRCSSLGDDLGSPSKASLTVFALARGSACVHAFKDIFSTL